MAGREYQSRGELKPQLPLSFAQGKTKLRCSP